ncbi:MAG: TlpA disulfide reductase family protein [Pseudomonadota bacterium]
MERRRTDGSASKSLLAVVVVAVVVAFAVNAHAVGVRQSAPDFTLEALDGENLRLQEYRGQVVLINFWASWCGPCRQEMPVLDRLHQRYEEAGFTVLGVNVEGKRGPAEKIARKSRLTFPVLIDAGQKVSETYDLEAMPSTVLVDRDGVVRYVHRGYKPGDEAKYLEVVKQLILE